MNMNMKLLLCARHEHEREAAAPVYLLLYPDNDNKPGQKQTNELGAVAVLSVCVAHQHSNADCVHLCVRALGMCMWAVHTEECMRLHVAAGTCDQSASCRQQAFLYYFHPDQWDRLLDTSLHTHSP
jgi:hypothetical protein